MKEIACNLSNLITKVAEENISKCQGNVLMSKDWSKYKTRDKEERKLAVLRRINSSSLSH